MEALALHVPECCLPPPLRPVRPAVGVAPPQRILHPLQVGALGPEAWGQKGVLHHQQPVPCTRDVAVPPADVNPCPQGAPVSVENQCKVAT